MTSRKHTSEPAAAWGWAGLGVLALLITIGSLYPFEVATPEPGAVRRLFSDWTLLSSRGDMLGNAALFVPWGLVGMLAGAARVGTIRAAMVNVAAGFILALACQVAQLWVPARTAAMADVFWNMVGVAVGLVVGRQAMRRVRSGVGGSSVPLAPAVLLGAWLLAYWLPLLPSIDYQLLKDNLNAALSATNLSIGAFMLGVAMASMSGHLLSSLIGLRASLVCLPLFLALAAFGKLFIVSTRIDIAAPLGFLVGTAAWWASPWAQRQARVLAVGLVLIAAYTVQALSPFQLRETASAFGWVPLVSMLEGSMLANAQALADSLVVFVSFLYLVREAGGRPAVASIGLAVWVLGLEVAQMFIATRSADVTLPLLVLLLGQASRMPRPLEPADKPRAIDALPVESAATAAQSMGNPMIVASAAVATITLGLHWALRVPDIPYNVRELFLADGHPLALAVFAFALLWAGAGAVWLGSLLSRSRHPAWLLPPAALAVSLVSLLLLSMSVTSESIGDIAGASNVYWFVTNKDSWGTGWRDLFLWLDAWEFIDSVERCVRFSALYAPLPIMLGLLVFALRWRDAGIASARRAAAVAVSALLALWLCKAIAFDWSSTDNLNELIARDGDWGWGGGGYLYALLLLVLSNSLFLAVGVGGRGLTRLGAAISTVFAVPLGWWLLNQGLEPQVEKYESVFSGAQFLLGPDRVHILPTQVLFVRWVAVQTSATLVIATGAWLGMAVLRSRAGHDAVALPRHRRPSQTPSARS